MLRQPLQDLPLEPFLAPANISNPNIPRPASPFKHPGSAYKRPLSPSFSSTLFSPAKRRILAQEGLISPPPAKSPLAASESGLTTPRFAPAYFHELIQGPDSPKRRLDFGSKLGESSSSESAGPATPPPAQPSSSRRMTRSTTSPPPKRVRASPRLASSPSDKASPSPSSRSPTTPRRLISPSATKIRTTSPPPMLVPREMPPPPDPASIHYPGFDVHQDTHIVLPRARSSVAVELSDKDKEKTKEGEKENLPPRRSSRKAGVDEMKKAAMEKAGSPTPRRSARLSTSSSNGVSPEMRRRERRRMVDDEDADL
ncbi:hypothetical protein BV25DRAFT_1913343 [Artomyces pyxidatus]|uniref:Uncharacterized protein n=1 Tax=Artomyces pyxidatus TaxID=48021 RepID=A0ACB8TAH5_9AGAM|nr:hypothetical protein BV25DRAFT_1913343 [Artomyces pyxidatus]